MGFFGIGKSDPEAGRRSLERQAVWQQALTQNRLPGFVAERLSGAASGKMPWMATMTPAELLVMRSHGIRPIATVTGTCALHYGFSWTRGHAGGWRTAAARLVEEAQLCQANAVVDVKMRTAHLAVGSTMDYTLVGTAIKVEGLPPSADPIIATISTIEFARLLEAGIVPVGLAIGAAYQWLQTGLYDLEGGGTWNNRPLTELGRFWESIRREALSDMRADGRRQGNGVLAHIQFGEMLKREGDQTTTAAYLARYIIMGSVVDTQDRHPVPHGITTVVDMRDGADLTGGASHNTYPTETEEGAI